MAAPDAGSAFAPVIVSEPPRTVGDSGYGLLLNGLYGPAAAAAARKNGGALPFIMGQFMVLRREAIDAIGGLECAQGQLVDDMFLGAKIVEAGYRNVVSPHPVRIIQYGLAADDFASTYLRWIMFSRSGLPGRDFKLISWLRGAVFWAGLIAAVAAALLGFWVAAALSALVPVAMAASINGLHHAYGSPRLRGWHALVSFGLVLVAPMVMGLTHVLREVNWRGRIYQLNASARLAAAPPAPAQADELPTLERLVEPNPIAESGSRW
jgi:ceramide glucosyltransferase